MNHFKMKLIVIFLFLLCVSGCSDTINIVNIPSNTPTVVTPITGTFNPDEIEISINIATDEYLSQFSSYEEFIEIPDDGYQKIAFTINHELENFSFIDLELKNNTSGLEFNVEETLFTLEKLSPETPFVVTWMEQGLIPHRGISYTESNNITKYFYISMSGKDDSIMLTEFEP